MRIKRTQQTDANKENSNPKKSRPGDELLKDYVPEFICDEFPDFSRTLKTHGITLSNTNSVAHKIRCEPMEFVARLQSNLKGETSEVLDNFVSGFGALMEKNPLGTLRDMEMISRKNDDTENDDIISTSYPPLPCLLIRVHCLQLRIATELIVPFTDPKEFVSENDRELLSSRIVHCFKQGLNGFIQEPDKLIDSIWDMIEHLENEFKCEAIQLLTVFPDSKHDQIGDYLLNLFESDFSSYLRPILEASHTLNLSRDKKLKFQAAIEKEIGAYTIEDIPVVASYLLHNAVHDDISARAVIDRLSSIVSIDHFKSVSHSSTPNQTGLPDFGSQDVTNIGRRDGPLTYSTDLRVLSANISSALIHQKHIGTAIEQSIRKI